MKDLIIIGAGIVGLATAYNFKKRHPKLDVLILEKENDIALHQTGHNSGVIHSGIYYKPDSLKAQNCITGYKQLLDFAKDHGIAYDLCGKLIVATEEDELGRLEQLYKNGLKNGLQHLEILDRQGIQSIEPYCQGLKAIRVPQTGIIDYRQVAQTLKQLFLEMGGIILFSQKVRDIKNEDCIRVVTDQDTFRGKQLIACAGLYSDQVARMSSNTKDLRILPFRGEYYKLKPNKRYLVNHLIYPVPNPEFPFLGVHFTRTIHGDIEAGPNAVLAFKREGYRFSDFNLKELYATLSWPGFWKLAKTYGRIGLKEMHNSLSKSAYARQLQKLVPDIQEDDLIKSEAGVRAQACDPKGQLLDDFNFVKDGAVLHVRNAPSPAATSSFAIANSIYKHIYE